MKALVLSDLHLDFAKFSPVHNGHRIDEDADVVILAGDITEGVQGIRWARETFTTKEIVYIAGNHEFYNNNITALPTYLREVAERMGVHYLARNAVDIAGVRFLGIFTLLRYALMWRKAVTPFVRIPKPSKPFSRRVPSVNL